ncbi:MAG: transposase [Nonlabens sp.]
MGYKIHLLMSTLGNLKDMGLTPANAHDIRFLKSRRCDGSKQREIIDDRGYISKQQQADLFTCYGVKRVKPSRRNQLLKSAF